MDQAADFAGFLSKLFQMRGILANVRQNPEDGMLDGIPGNTPIVDQWLSELHFTSKLMSFSPMAEIYFKGTEFGPRRIARKTERSTIRRIGSSEF